ncbi:MAG TPA: glycosyltransferase family 1 protein [Chitinophagales bacterium]|nr:glycosyltransferase family 1 protein [Chitinophagales bacterium]HNM31491.1 glycosyltransferase family 1 protein [Chitinophagales bacterium]
MTVAVYLPENVPYSMKYCAWNIMAICKKKYSVKFISFSSLQNIPETNIDVLWDPRCGGGIAPPVIFRKMNNPLVLTVHGMAMFTLPLTTFHLTISQQIKGYFKSAKERLKWKIMTPHIAQIMTVSEYTKSELLSTIHFPAAKISAVWNGIDHEKFHPAAEKKEAQAPYFFTVISYQKKKNFERLIEAYTQLEEATRPDLIAIVKPYTPTNEIKKIKGLHIINTPIEEQQLIAYYQQALALVFVSLHEGFGLPIVEAMACGIPVITSSTTSCKEIAGDAALLVNPTSTNDIADAMRKLSDSKALRQQLSYKGLERAKDFSWEKSAAAFYEILLKSTTSN